MRQSLTASHRLRLSDEFATTSRRHLNVSDEQKTRFILYRTMLSYRSVTSRQKLLFLLTFAAVLVLLIYNTRLTSENSFDFDKGLSPEQAYFAWESQYRSCLIKTLSLGGIQYGSFSKIIEVCNGRYALKLFDTKIFFNGHDNKLAILPR